MFTVPKNIIQDGKGKERKGRERKGYHNYKENNGRAEEEQMDKIKTNKITYVARKKNNTCRINPVHADEPNTKNRKMIPASGKHSAKQRVRPTLVWAMGLGSLSQRGAASATKIMSFV